MSKFSIILFLATVIAIFSVISAKGTNSDEGKIATLSKQRNFLSTQYQRHRSTGKLSTFADSIYRALLGSGSATATPSKYGIMRTFPAGNTSSPCASPVGEGLSFGLNVCYNLFDYETNTTNSAIYKYSSTTATATFYNSTGCTGSVANKMTAPIGSCAPEGVTKILAASTSPVVSTNPGFSATVYDTQKNCKSKGTAGIQGMMWVPTTTNNCVVYDTVANMGTSSSWACTGPNSATFIAYNTTSNCYGQGEAETFPLYPSSSVPYGANCGMQETEGLVSGFVAYGCSSAAASKPALRNREAEDN